MGQLHFNIQKNPMGRREGWTLVPYVEPGHEWEGKGPPASSNPSQSPWSCFLGQHCNGYNYFPFAYPPCSYTLPEGALLLEPKSWKQNESKLDGSWKGIPPTPEHGRLGAHAPDPCSLPIANE